MRQRVWGINDVINTTLTETGVLALANQLSGELSPEKDKPHDGGEFLYIIYTEVLSFDLQATSY